MSYYDYDYDDNYVAPPVYTNRPRRGRGSYSYSNPTTSRSTSNPTLPPDREITEGLGTTVVRTLAKPVVSTSTGDPIKPANVKYVGSYNWVDEAHPTIIVPGTHHRSLFLYLRKHVSYDHSDRLPRLGSPPEWRARPYPYRVPFDRGVRMVDQNGFRMSTSRASTLLPLFRAADVVAEDAADTSVDWPAVDVVTDRNNLRKLLRWIQHPWSDAPRAGGREGSSNAGTLPGVDPLKDFRIDVQLGGRNTLLLHRWEKRTRELAEPPRSGCGINFERQSTTPAKGCERSTGHHRIVQYVSF